MAIQPGDTVEQLRHDIDRGRTGDKVDFPDPSVAPLGTDEEAAGTPIDPRVIAEIRKAEARMAPPRDALRSSVSQASDIMLWFAIVGTVLAWWGAAWWITSLGD
jgi:hypothetical protein